MKPHPADRSPASGNEARTEVCREECLADTKRRTGHTPGAWGRMRPSAFSLIPPGTLRARASSVCQI